MTATIHPLKQRTRLYLAGPMRGRARFNFDAFTDAATWLRSAGYDVTSPAEHDLELGFDPTRTLEEQGFSLRDALAWDLQQVLTVDAVVTLPGWAHSAGALAEVATARAVGTPIIDYVEFDGDAAVAA